MTTLNLWADDVAAAAAWYAEVLGVEPYFERPGPPAPAAYVEFRIGDHQHELGLVDRRYAPPGTTTGEPAGAIVYWHVDDVRAALDALIAHGATRHEDVIERGDGTGFITASVVDPFGNVLGIMQNPHYLDVLAGR